MAKSFKYSPWDFFKDKKKGINPDDTFDYNGFNNYMTSAVLSMDLRYAPFARFVNRNSFNRLSKKHQAKAYNAFVGHSIYGDWKGCGGLRKKSDDILPETLDQVAIIMDCSKKGARDLILAELIDVAEVKDAYYKIYGYPEITSE